MYNLLYINTSLGRFLSCIHPNKQDLQTDFQHHTSCRGNICKLTGVESDGTPKSDGLSGWVVHKAGAEAGEGVAFHGCLGPALPAFLSHGPSWGKVLPADGGPRCCVLPLSNSVDKHQAAWSEELCPSTRPAGAVPRTTL